MTEVETSQFGERLYSEHDQHFVRRSQRGSRSNRGRARACAKWPRRDRQLGPTVRPPKGRRSARGEPARLIRLAAHRGSRRDVPVKRCQG